MPFSKILRTDCSSRAKPICLEGSWCENDILYQISFYFSVKSGLFSNIWHTRTDLTTPDEKTKKTCKFHWSLSNFTQGGNHKIRKFFTTRDHIEID